MQQMLGDREPCRGRVHLLACLYSLSTFPDNGLFSAFRSHWRPFFPKDAQTNPP